MKIVFNKLSTDQEFQKTESYNSEIRTRRRILGFALSVIAGIAASILSQITGKLFLSSLLSIVVCVFLLPRFFQDFVPTFKMKPDRPAFLYSAMLEKARNTRLKIDGIRKDKCTLTLLAETLNGRIVEKAFILPLERKEEITEEIVDLEHDVVYLPNTFTEDC